MKAENALGVSLGKANAFGLKDGKNDDGWQATQTVGGTQHEHLNVLWYTSL